MRTFLLTVMVMGFFTNWLRAEVYKEPLSGIEFPESLGTYKRGKTTPYQAEPGKGGIAIEYRAEDAEVTVYVRAIGDEAIKTSADWVSASLSAIKVLEARGQYSNVKIYTSAPAKDRPGWSSAAFTSSSTNRFLMSFIYCKVDDTHLVKIRATTGKTKNEPLQACIKNLQEIADQKSKK